MLSRNILWRVLSKVVILKFLSINLLPNADYHNHVVGFSLSWKRNGEAELVVYTLMFSGPLYSAVTLDGYSLLVIGT